MIHYRVDIDDLHSHHFRVTLTVPRPAAQQELALPVWINGSYMVRDFGRHLSALQARQGRRAVPLRQLDKSRWLADCGTTRSGRAALVVQYRVYAFDTSVRAAFLDDLPPAARERSQAARPCRFRSICPAKSHGRERKARPAGGAAW